MGRKKQIFLQLYTKDYTGDEKLRMCSPAAWGVYSYLLCLMNSQPVRGAYQLSRLELRPDLKRSKTNRVLSASSESAKIPPFAEILQRQMPWKKTEILRALRELIFYRVIVIEGDALIQPRMYREGGNSLKSDIEKEQPEPYREYNDEGENDEVKSERENDAQNSNIKVRENNKNNVPKNNNKNDIPARAIAHVRSENMSYENINNNINDKGNNKGEKSKKEKQTAFVPPTLEEVREYFKERGTNIDPESFWAYYTANGWVQTRGKPIRNWKACLITWERRSGEFGNGRGLSSSRQKGNDTVLQTQSFEDMEEFG